MPVAREIITPQNEKLNVSRNLKLPHSPGFRAGSSLVHALLAEGAKIAAQKQAELTRQREAEATKQAQAAEQRRAEIARLQAASGKKAEAVKKVEPPKAIEPPKPVEPVRIVESPKVESRRAETKAVEPARRPSAWAPCCRKKGCRACPTIMPKRSGTARSPATTAWNPA